MLLNFTGETVKILLPKNDERFQEPNCGELVLPSIGRPYVKIEQLKEANANFHSERHIVKGLPAPMDGVLFIVQDNIAQLLCGTRTDLVILYNKRAENAENPLNKDEIMLVGDDLAYFSSFSSDE